MLQLYSLVLSVRLSVDHHAGIRLFTLFACAKEIVRWQPGAESLLIAGLLRQTEANRASEPACLQHAVTRVHARKGRFAPPNGIPSGPRGMLPSTRSISHFPFTRRVSASSSDVP